MYWGRSDFWDGLVTVDMNSPRGKIDKVEARIGKALVKHLASKGARATVLDFDILRDHLSFSVNGEDFLPKVFGDAHVGLDDDSLLELFLGHVPEFVHVSVQLL